MTKTANVVRSLLASLLTLQLPAAVALEAQQSPPKQEAQEPFRPETTADYNRRLTQLREMLGRPSTSEEAEYRVGPEDLLEISVFGVPELDRAVRVSSSGEISLPLVGVVAAAGRTLHELEQHLESMYGRKYVKDPQVSVFVKELRSQGVSVFGAVARPGVYQIHARATLIEVLSLAGGLADDAGDRIIILRARPEAAGADPAMEADLRDVLASGDPATNIAVFPGDAVKVPRAGIVYVVGAVKKPGGFVLRSNENISVLQALALAEGLTRTSARGAARIIRTDPASGARQEIPVHLGRVLAGKAADPLLAPRDIVFVPDSVARGTFYRSAEAALGIVSGLIVFRR